MKKIERFTFWLCVVISIIMIVLARPIQDLDEVWNFNVARCISNGLIPYRDISMVSTPLLGLLLAIPISFYGQQIFVERVFFIVLSILIFVSIFKIFRITRIREEVSIFVVFTMLLIIAPYLSINYNWLCLLFILLIMWFEIQKNKVIKLDRYETDIVIGILAGLAICTKQSTGLFVIIAMIVVPLIYMNNRRSLKQISTSIGMRVIGCLIPATILYIYLSANGAFKDFIDYAVSGIGTFSNKREYLKLLDSDRIVTILFSIIIPIVLAASLGVNIYRKIKKRVDITFLSLTLYSLVAFLAVFPISDEEHFYVAIVPSLILIVYILKNVINRHLKKDYKYWFEFSKVCTILLILSYTLYIEISNAETLGKLSKYRFQNHYDSVYLSQFLDESITEVDEYIKQEEKKVYILDAYAAIYMIPIDSYNKDYDTFCVGNFGKGGEDKIIERISSEDAIYLVLSDVYEKNWQNPDKVTQYVRDNLEYIGTKNVFDIYVNKQKQTEEQSNIVTDENVPAEEPVNN